MSGSQHSINGHIEIDNKNFNEFTNGTISILQNGLDGKTPGSVAFYTSTGSSSVNIELNNVAQKNASLIQIPSGQNLTFQIVPNLTNGVVFGPYSFNINVMDVNAPFAIIDSLDVSGQINSAFVQPLSYTRVINPGGSRTYTFSANDGPADKIQGFKVTNITNGIQLFDANGNALVVGSISTTSITVNPGVGFTGRIIFSVALVDVNNLQRQSSVTVSDFDASHALPPIVSFSDFSLVNNIESLYEPTQGSILSVGTINFLLDNRIYDDGNFELNWNLVQGSQICTINDGNNFVGTVPLSATIPTKLKISAISGKFGTLLLSYSLAYNGTIIASTTQQLHVNILPASTVTLQAVPKRVYMMNKHAWNINDLTQNGYGLIEPQPGTYLWSSPTSTPIDGLTDGSAVASLVPAKSNFNKQLIMNLSTFDGYAGRNYNPNDNTVRILLETLRINVVSSNGNSLSLRIHPNNLNSIESNMVLGNASQQQITAELAKWTPDSTLSMTDIIFDASINGFAGRVDLTYYLADTLGNISNQGMVSFYVCSYSTMRVKQIIGDGGSVLLKNAPSTVQIIYENSYTDNDIDFISAFSGQPQVYASKLCGADIDFTRASIVNFTVNGIENDNSTNILTFDSIIDQFGHTFKNPTSLIHIGLKKTVTLVYSFNPVIEADYKFNVKVPANIKSISGNSSIVFAKQPPATIDVFAYVTDTEYFNKVVSKSVVTDLFSADGFDITSNKILASAPVVINNSLNTTSLNATGNTQLNNLQANVSSLDNLTVNSSFQVNCPSIMGNIQCSTLNASVVISDSDIDCANVVADNGIFSSNVSCDELHVTNVMSSGSVQTNGANVVGELVALQTATSQLTVNGNAIVSGNISCDHLSANVMNMENLVASNIVSNGDVSAATLDISADGQIDGNLYVEGAGYFGNGLNVTGTLTSTSLFLDADLRVTASSVMSDLTADVIDVNTDLNVIGNFNAVDNELYVTKSNGFVCNLPVTFGTGTSDVILLVNGSIQTYGNFNINDTDIDLQNGALTIGASVNMKNGASITGGLDVDNILLTKGINNGSSTTNGFNLLASVTSSSNVDLYTKYSTLGPCLLMSVVNTGSSQINIFNDSAQFDTINANKQSVYMNVGSGQSWTKIMSNI